MLQYPSMPVTRRLAIPLFLLLAQLPSKTLPLKGDGDHVYLTPLTPVQQRILDLLDLSPTIYWRVAQHCSEPLRQMSEP